MILKWIKQNYAVFILCWLLSIMAVTYDPLTVSAAKEAPPTVSTCLLVATGNGLQISRCQDVDRGVVFYINQHGWMMPDPK